MQKVDLRKGVIIDPDKKEPEQTTLLDQLKLVYHEHKVKEGEYPTHVRVSPDLLVELIAESGGFMFCMGKDPSSAQIHTINFILEEKNEG